MNHSMPGLPVHHQLPDYSNSCSLSWWCHSTISSSVDPSSSCLQSFPASESFPVSQLFTSGGQSIGASASALVLPMNIQGWFLLGLTGVIKAMSLLFNILSRFVVRVCSDSCPLSQWCHPTISSSVGPFSCCLQSFPASGSFPVSWVFPSGGQSIGASASASVLPVNVQNWFPLGLTGWSSLLSKAFSRVFSKTTVQKHQFDAFGIDQGVLEWDLLKKVPIIFIISTIIWPQVK